MIEFDKSAPGRGVNAECRVENGKVTLEWQPVLTQIDFRGLIRLKLIDAVGNVVLNCMQASDEEEPLESVLLQPHLWTGTDNPYLYRLEAVLEDRQGNRMDSVIRQFPLRSVELRRKQGEDVEKLFLNGELFVPKAVLYESSACVADLEKVLDLGATCICLRDPAQISSEITDFCDKNGLLLIVHIPGKLMVGEKSFTVDKDRTLEDYLGKIPTFSNMNEALYKARWSKRPFVCICAESLSPTKGGNYAVTCSSNCKKVALYSDGRLFEFQQGTEVFTFQEIPVKGPCIMLAVEGEGCTASLSVHKTFTKISPSGDN